MKTNLVPIHFLLATVKQENRPDEKSLSIEVNKNIHLAATLLP